MFAWRVLPLRAETAEAPVPVLDCEDSLVLVGSGRLDARESLISALNVDPARRWSDTALMGAAVARWGEAAADRLMGNFGFAAWDQKQRRLILAKDYFGSVPVFYHEGDGFVAFGTSPGAILALGLCPRDLDPAAVADLLARPLYDAETNLYKGIQRVRRGATVSFDPAGSRQSIYWRPKRGSILKLKNDEAYVEATQAVLAEVMRGHLRATHPIGVMLSGGFDSGAVAATLATMAPDREIFGFTTVPVAGDPAYARGQGREWEHVKALARMHKNLRIQAVSEKKVTPLDPAFREFFADTGLPMPNLHVMTRRTALAEAARACGVRTLLTGDAGNRTLTGEGDPVFAELFWSARWFALGREIVGTSRFRGVSWSKVLWQEALRDIVPRFALRAWHAARGKGTRPGTECSFLRDSFARESGFLDKSRDTPHAAAKLHLQYAADLRPHLLDMQVAWADAVTLAHNRMGIEIGSPLRDRRLIDFILTLPATQFRRNGVTRFLARRVLADRLPPETLVERGYFESFADQEHWIAGWWDDAARYVDGQHPADLSAEAIDLDALRARLAEGPPEDLSRSYDDQLLIGYGLAQSLHINQFLRWHQGMND